MKKYSIVLAFLICTSFVYAQQNGISFGLPRVDVSQLNVGDEIIIPIKVVSKTPNGPVLGSFCIGFDLFFSFDHNLLQWKGSADDPIPGVQNFSPLCSYSTNDWIFNDNGIVQVCLWQDPVYSGEDFPDGTILFEYVFIYKGGLKKGESSPLIWTTEQIVEKGRVKTGKTDAYTDKLAPYEDVVLINGSIYFN